MARTTEMRVKMIEMMAMTTEAKTKTVKQEMRSQRDHFMKTRSM